MQDELKTSYYLWQIYHIQQDIGKAQADIRKQKSLLADANRSCQVRAAGSPAGRHRCRAGGS